MANEEIMKIKDVILTAIPSAEKICLFGSHAYGTPNDDSGYDFYVAIPNGNMRGIDAAQSVYRIMRGASKKPVDILAGTVETFGRRSKVKMTLERNVANKGVVLYARR